MTLRKYLPRFSVRALLFVTTAVCLWLGYWVHSANVQKRAVAAIALSGGICVYSNSFDANGHRIPESKINSPGWIERMMGIDFVHKVVEVELGPHAGDAHVAYAAQLPDLQWLSCGGWNVTNEGLKHLSQLNELEYLGLWCTNISDSGLAQIAELKNLKGLSLGYSKIEGPGYAHLKNLPHLVTLQLVESRFSDEAMQHINDMEGLQERIIVPSGGSLSDR